MTGLRRGSAFGLVALGLASAACGRTNPSRDSAALAMQRDTIPVLVGAGDIADCKSDGAARTALLLDSIRGTIFIAGDVAYQTKKNPRPLITCFEPAWGRHRARIRPAIGNHEYADGRADDYFAYFGDRAGPPPGGYYSYDEGNWHVIALNTNIAIDSGSPQAAWLRADLGAHIGHCTLAYMHHPRFSSGPHDERDRLDPFWRMFVSFGVSVVLAGHDHLYERFAPLDAEGLPDSVRGVRQFVVGTGGANRYQMTRVLPGSEAHSSETFGLLRLALLPDRYRWEFIPVDTNGFRDRGESVCHPTHAAR